MKVSRILSCIGGFLFFAYSAFALVVKTRSLMRLHAPRIRVDSPEFVLIVQSVLFGGVYVIISTFIAAFIIDRTLDILADPNRVSRTIKILVVFLLASLAGHAVSFALAVAEFFSRPSFPFLQAPLPADMEVFYYYGLEDPLAFMIAIGMSLIYFYADDMDRLMKEGERQQTEEQKM